jgi:hypothetical protein
MVLFIAGTINKVIAFEESRNIPCNQVHVLLVLAIGLSKAEVESAVCTLFCVTLPLYISCSSRQMHVLARALNRTQRRSEPFYALFEYGEPTQRGLGVHLQVVCQPAI